jgi:tetratricopeptide (TPR) repeat protein
MSYPSYLGRAVAYYKLKKYREAIPDLGKANEGIHNNVGLLFRRGLSYFRTYQYDQALVDFKDVTKINPKDAKAFTNAAAALIALDQPAAALESVNKALVLQPDKFGLTTRAVALTQLKRFDQAFADIKEVLRADDKYEFAYLALGKLYAKENKYDDAIKNYNLALTIDPSDDEVITARAFPLGIDSAMLHRTTLKFD